MKRIPFGFCPPPTSWMAAVPGRPSGERPPFPWKAQELSSWTTLWWSQKHLSVRLTDSLRPDHSFLTNCYRHVADSHRRACMHAMLSSRELNTSTAKISRPTRVFFSNSFVGGHVDSTPVGHQALPRVREHAADRVLRACFLGIQSDRGVLPIVVPPYCNDVGPGLARCGERLVKTISRPSRSVLPCGHSSLRRRRREIVLAVPSASARVLSRGHRIGHFWDCGTVVLRIGGIIGLQASVRRIAERCHGAPTAASPSGGLTCQG